MLLILLKFGVSFSLIAFLLYRIGFGEIRASLVNTNGVWILAAIVLFTVSYLLGSLQWWRLLRAENVNIPYRQTLGFYFVGLFFNNFLVSQLGGDVFRMLDIRKTTENSAAAVSTVFLDRVFGLLIMSGMALVAAPFFLSRQHVDSRYSLFLLILGACWILLLFLLFSKRVARPLAWLFEKTVPDRICNRCREIYDNIYRFGRNRRVLLQIVLISIFVQSTRILTHYLLCRSLGVNLSPVYFFLFIPVVAILASLPVSIGGLGIREQSAVVLFGSVGMAAQDATVMEFLAYLIAIVTSIPGGLLFAMRRSSKKTSDKGGES